MLVPLIGLLLRSYLERTDHPLKVQQSSDNNECSGLKSLNKYRFFVWAMIYDCPILLILEVCYVSCFRPDALYEKRFEVVSGQVGTRA